jgi:hypothetical protein
MMLSFYLAARTTLPEIKKDRLELYRPIFKNLSTLTLTDLSWFDKFCEDESKYRK